MSYLQQFLEKVKESVGGIPEHLVELKAQALLYSVQYLHSLNFSFQDTFFIAGLFGLVGALPVIHMWLSDLFSLEKRKKYNIPITFKKGEV